MVTKTACVQLLQILSTELLSPVISQLRSTTIHHHSYTKFPNAALRVLFKAFNTKHPVSSLQLNISKYASIFYYKNNPPFYISLYVSI
jgi:hypothetical protein